MSAFNRFTHDERQAPDYRLPGRPQHGHPGFSQGPYTREVPRYDPSATAPRQRDPMGAGPGMAPLPPSQGPPPPPRQLQHGPQPPVQVFDYAPKEGGPGTTFTATVDVGPVDPASRQFRFVFGSRRIGAFLEHRRGFGQCTLSAGVPRFEDTAWWSSKVPVYLLVIDPQTDQDLHSVQVGEFVYISSPGRAKRAREDEGLVGLPTATSPIRRANSTNSQRNAYGPAGPGPYADPTAAHRLGHRPTASQSSFAMNPSLMGAGPPGGPPAALNPYTTERGPAQMPMQEPPVRYVAEPRDQYPGHLRAPSFSLSGAPDEHPYHPDARQGGPAYMGMQHPGGPGQQMPYGYQASPTSASFRSPFSTTGNYMSPPHSATFAKSESSYDQPFPSADSEASSDTPTLQRTSTLSASSRRGPTPTASSSQQPSVAQPATGWLPSAKAKLDVMGNLDDMSRNWSGEEFAIGRRLVQFWRKQDGNIIRINFRPVEPGATRSPHAVIISCIYWEERQECFFTSVDAIFLLESLIGNRFAVEEKNRIRRNLEGFRPLTVSKGKPESEAFFKLIMGFPAPKPRNIEKDVKAFPWRILTSALRKIIGKYSASYHGLTETGNAASASNASSQSEMGPSQPPAIGLQPAQIQQQSGASSGMSTMAQQRPSYDLGGPGHGASGPGIVGGLGGGEMPPPAMRRAHEMVPAPSRGSPGGSQQPSQQQHSSPSQVQGSGAQARSPSSATVAQQQQQGPSATSQPSKSPALNLSISVPPNPVSILPSLEGLGSDLLDRRPSGGVPMSAGLGGLDFSDFMFASPGQMPSSTSGWPGAGRGSVAGSGNPLQGSQQGSSGQQGPSTHGQQGVSGDQTGREGGK